MKKMIKVLSAAVLLGTMAGCTDAVAKFEQADEVLMKVGNITVTKGQMYNTLLAQSGADVIRNQGLKVIGDIEVEETEELRAAAQIDFDYYNALYGGTLTDTLAQSGMTPESYMEVLIDGKQSDALIRKYIEENLDSYIEKLQPIMATVLSFNTEEDANAAMSALADGSKTLDDILAEGKTTSEGTTEVITINTTDYGTTVNTVLRGMKPDDGWTVITSAEKANVYVARVDDNDPQNFRQVLIDELDGQDEINDDALSYYFKKYNFHIYDKNVLDIVTNTYPEIVVQ